MGCGFAIRQKRQKGVNLMPEAAKKKLEGHCDQCCGRSRKKLTATSSTRPNADGNVGWSEISDFLCVHIVPEWQHHKNLPAQKMPKPNQMVA